jgi:hypothetical protein
MNENTPAEALKPCPFCGSSASENHAAVEDGFEPSIDCDTCHALVSGISFEGATMAWNSRLDELPPPELSAEVKENIGFLVSLSTADTTMLERYAAFASDLRKLGCAIVRVKP